MIKQDSPGVKFMPPLAFMICLLTGIIIECVFPWKFSLTETYIQIIFGCVIVILGFIIALFAHEKFISIGTNVPLNLPATELVDRGLFCFSRNPMYLGMSVFFIGTGVATGSYWILIAYFILFLYFNFYIIPREEAYMNRAFGEKYQDYCKRVRRWL
jgi:protein-S-isoprenylcysteine O-methyltransferase Ste14